MSDIPVTTHGPRCNLFRFFETQFNAQKCVLQTDSAQRLHIQSRLVMPAKGGIVDYQPLLDFCSSTNNGRTYFTDRLDRLRPIPKLGGFTK